LGGHFGAEASIGQDQIQNREVGFMKFDEIHRMVDCPGDAANFIPVFAEHLFEQFDSGEVIFSYYYLKHIERASHETAAKFPLERSTDLSAQGWYTGSTHPGSIGKYLVGIRLVASPRKRRPNAKLAHPRRDVECRS